MTGGGDPERPGVRRFRVHAAVGALLVLIVLTRAAVLGQPPVENYVGRQVPTAMVARNIERGSGFLNPSLDVAPFPNRFLVEPPVYAWAAVQVRRASGLPLTGSGRLLSALGVAFAAWGLYGLVRRREGEGVALLAVAAFAAFPVTLRYGRAFQPDALMLGCLVCGLNLLDVFDRRGGKGRHAAGFVLVATGLAMKVISAYALVPVIFAGARPRRPGTLLAAAAALLPAAAWYAYAAAVLRGDGSRASADNGAVWLSVLVPTALFRAETYGHVARFLFVRAFTPLGPPLALFGFFFVRRPGDAFWRAWGVAALAAMAVVAAKLHHEYYWLSVAPVAAVGVARSLAAVGRHGVRGRWAAAATAAVFLGSCGLFAASTWRTPDEWKGLGASAAAVRSRVPADAWVVAPEALLFAADRRGCRLEFTRPAARRAAGEWGEALDDGPLALVEFYRTKGARYFADVAPVPTGPDRRALHAAVRRRYNVLIDRPGVLIAALNDPQ